MICVFVVQYSAAMKDYWCVIFAIGSERFNECLELIKEQNLYTEAFQLYTGPEYKTIAGCYGEYLIGKKRYEESGIGKILPSYFLN